MRRGYHHHGREVHTMRRGYNPPWEKGDHYAQKVPHHGREGTPLRRRDHTIGREVTTLHRRVHTLGER